MDTSGVKAYVFELAEDQASTTPVFSPVEIVVTDAVAEANYVLGQDLERGKNYFWRVRARDDYFYSQGLYHEVVGPHKRLASRRFRTPTAFNSVKIKSVTGRVARSSTKSF